MEDDLGMIQTNLATDEMVEPADSPENQETEPLIQILPLVNNQTIIAEIESIAALDIGQPDCKLINPVLIKEDGTFSKFLDTLTNETEMAISSDKILMMLLPKQSVLEEYLKLVR